ncbi:MAG: leucine-rich repeat domain-containing protein [Bacilli bacterium]|nr:leucine-rich repeat domain-containing protein [Bacilli bacterium]
MYYFQSFRKTKVVLCLSIFSLLLSGCGFFHRKTSKSSNSSSSGEPVSSSDATSSYSSSSSKEIISVLFYDYDGTLLEATTGERGEDPVYPYDDPTREDDEEKQIQYSFYRWEKTSETQTSVSYTASYVSCTIGLDFFENEVDYYHGISTDVIVPFYWKGFNINTIGEEAFASSSIESITLPDSIATIGPKAFTKCKSLASIELGNNLTTIREEAFSYCSALTEITIPDSLIELYRMTFYFCESLTSATLGNCLKTINEYAFAFTALTSVSIPDSVETIKYEAFSCCRNLISVELGKNVQFIGSSVFNNCLLLEKIVIHESTTFVDEGVFYGCHSLVIFCEHSYRPKDWNYDWNPLDCPVIWGYSEESIYSYENLVCIDSSNKTYIIDFDDQETDIHVSSSINGLNVCVPAQILTSEDFVLNGETTSFVLEENVSITGNIFERPIDQNTTRLVFSGSHNLKEFILCDNCGVTTIPIHAFYHCESLETITLGSELKSIDSWSFSYCTSLTTINYLGTVEQWQQIYKNVYWNETVPATYVTCSDGVVILS